MSFCVSLYGYCKMEGKSKKGEFLEFFIKVLVTCFGVQKNCNYLFAKLKRRK